MLGGGELGAVLGVGGVFGEIGYGEEKFKASY